MSHISTGKVQVQSNLKAIKTIKNYIMNGLEHLKKRIISILHLIRVYSKGPGKKAEFEEPFTLKRGSSVLDMAKAVHMDFARKLKYARIWSKTKYQSQMVNRDHILEDEDIIELHI
jgi:ribosome-interacting GTPase 1